MAYKKYQKAGNARHYEKPYWRLYTRLIKSARERKIPLRLTYEKYVKYICSQTHCHYCNAKLTWVKNGPKATKVNIDRKNNKLGYTVRNVVASCPRCNMARGRNFSYKEWKIMTDALKYKNFKKKNLN